jgi:hypothetical protein
MAKKTTKAVWGWVLDPKANTFKTSDLDKSRLTAQFEPIVTAFNERYAKAENAEDDAKEINYPVLFFSYWKANFFYISTKYRSPSQYAIAPHFDLGLARLQMTGSGTVNVAYMRHTGKWEPLYESISIETALKAVQDDPWFNVF